jgi:hypothetical protein
LAKAKLTTKVKNMEHKMNRNLKGEIFESTNRFRIYNAGQHYNLPTTTSISKLHQSFHNLDDITAGRAAVVAAAPALNTRGKHGTKIH